MREFTSATSSPSGENFSFGRAAKRIHVDQTALSRAIRDLEEEFGVPLFVRLPRKLQLRPTGQLLLPEYRSFLSG